MTLPVPLAGPGVAALAVYAEPTARTRGITADVGASSLSLQMAAERGFEGVACVDDAARAALLLCRVWRRYGLPWARDEARAYLQFLLYMQEDDGRFANFILDWDGHKNVTGPTSVPGGPQWQARALHALGAAVAAFGNEPDGEAYQGSFLRGLAWLDHPLDYLDVRAEGVLAMLEYRNAELSGGDPGVGGRAVAWAEEIASHVTDGVLPNAAEHAHDVHLWGHFQEAALARVGLAFGRPDLVAVARDSAEALLVSAVERAFAAPRTLPFDVSAVCAGLAALGEVTGEERYRVLTRQARAWFHGRNTANGAVYDRRQGRVYDGIDDGVISANSGAESNVEGAQALFDELPWATYAVVPQRIRGAAPTLSGPDRGSGGGRFR